MKRPYDAKLGRITEQDREYADDLLCDLSNIDTLKESKQTVAEWFRKVRYEAVMADRKQR
jgi:hypothetical protein